MHSVWTQDSVRSMETPGAADPRPASLLFHFLILLVVALPYFINLDRSALWDGNETFYAETPREMMQSGDYLAPRFNYEARTQKPPLTYWAVLLSYQVVGVSELGVRLPGAVAVVGTLLFTYGIARLLFSTRAALLSAAILGTSLRVFILARKQPLDILLLFWLTATAFFLIRALKKNSRSDWLLAYACAGLGFLTKGPVAWAIPGLTFLGWSLWTRRGSLRGAHPGAGALILAAVVLPWYLLIYLHYGWTYITDFFVQDNLARFTSEGLGPSRGPFYYLPVYLGDFFPWSLLSIAAGTYLWFERKSLRVANALAYGFPLVWCAVIFLLFSVSRNKQEYYIAPMYPVMAALLAGILDKTIFPAASLQSRLRAYWKVLILASALGFLALGLLLLFILPALMPGGPAVLHYAPTALLAVAGGLVVWSMSHGMLWKSVCAIALSLWLVLVIAGAAYLPAIEKLRPVKEICRTLQEQAQIGDDIGYYRAAVPSMIFYLRQPIFAVSDPDTMVEKFRGSPRVFCVVGEQDYRYFTGTRNLSLYVINRYQQLPTQLRSMLGTKSPAGEELLLVSNRPAPAPGNRGNREKQ